MDNLDDLFADAQSEVFSGGEALIRVGFGSDLENPTGPTGRTHGR